MCWRKSTVVRRSALKVVLVEVEVDSAGGQPAVVVVGLPDAAVKESQERVRAAVRNSGARVPLGNHHQPRSGRPA